MTMYNSDESSSVVRLNIGGKKFCTTIDTLTLREPHSRLAAMFSGGHTVYQDSEKGYVFLDRDGKHFRHILNWLRDGVVPNLSDVECSELVREAEYYQLLGLVDGMTEVLNNRRKDEELDAELTRTDIIKCVQSEKVRLRGVNLSGLDLSKLLLEPDPNKLVSELTDRV
ncbi:FH protein interacting protein FIP2 isoform X1 [Tanacetum coccineum]